MATPNLGIIHIAAAQNQKEVTANTAFDDLDLALTNVVIENMPDNHFPLPLTDATQNMVFRFVGVTTANRGVQLPSVRKLYIVENQTAGSPASSLIFGTASSPTGRTAVVPQGTNLYYILYCDGVNVDIIANSSTATGAPSSDAYVIGAPDPIGLPNAVVNPIAYYGPDVAPAVAGSLDDEFNGISLSGVWTQSNIGATSITIVDSCLVWKAANSSGDQIRRITKAVPGTPWEVTAPISIDVDLANTSGKTAGLVLEDGSGKLQVWGILVQTTGSQINGVSLALDNYTNQTTYSSTPAQIATGIVCMAASVRIFLKIKDDGVNLIYSYSTTGLPGTFITALSQSRTTFFASGPTKVGLGLDIADSVASNLYLTADWFRRTI